jgi:hypothetical protein
MKCLLVPTVACVVNGGIFKVEVSKETNRAGLKLVRVMNMHPQGSLLSEVLR